MEGALDGTAAASDEFEDRLARALGGIPNMTPAQGRKVSRFIRDNRLRSCLELGFAHGVGTAWIASAALGIGGQTTAIDLDAARTRAPRIEETLARVGLPPGAVEIHFEPTCYTWRLMKFLREGRASSFDFVYLDGAHSWFTDGFAFFLCERLLRPGGWLLFDDLDWTFGTSSIAGEERVLRMPQEERSTAQMRLVWDLLTKTGSGFDVLLEDGNWGFARRAAGRTPSVVVYRNRPLMRAALGAARRVKRRLTRSSAALSDAARP